MDKDERHEAIRYDLLDHVDKTHMLAEDTDPIATLALSGVISAHTEQHKLEGIPITQRVWWRTHENGNDVERMADLCDLHLQHVSQNMRLVRVEDSPAGTTSCAHCHDEPYTYQQRMNTDPVSGSPVRPGRLP